jgi:hypothetical protein
MTVKELLIKFQEYQLEYNVLNLNHSHNEAANLFMERSQIKNYTIHNVGSMLDLDKLQKKFDEILDNITEEDLQEWMDKKG